MRRQTWTMIAVRPGHFSSVRVATPVAAVQRRKVRAVATHPHAITFAPIRTVRRAAVRAVVDAHAPVVGRVPVAARALLAAPARAAASHPEASHREAAFPVWVDRLAG